MTKEWFSGLEAVTSQWRETKSGLENRASHGLQTDLKRQRDLTGRRVRMHSITSPGNLQSAMAEALLVEGLLVLLGGILQIARKDENGERLKD